MGYQNCTGPVHEGIGKDFPGMYESPIYESYSNNPTGEHFMGPIEG
jgi:hypothetical protein